MMMMTRTILTPLTSLGCMSLRSGGVLVAGAMIGLFVRLLILGRRLAVGIRGSFIIRALFVPSFAAKVDVAVAITVSLLMVFLSAGCILLGIVLRLVRMGRVVRGRSASSLTLLVSFVFCRRRVGRLIAILTIAAAGEVEAELQPRRLRPRLCSVCLTFRRRCLLRSLLRRRCRR
ncbi:hypothetical protein LINPERPRIM_LOCUS3345 [Linum perenne]